MRLTEILYEMATLQPQRTGLGLPIYVGPEEVYGTKLPHNLPRIKIRTVFGDIPLIIPQSENDIPYMPIPEDKKNQYEKRIPAKILKNIKAYIIKHRLVLTDFYFRKITEPEMKSKIGYK